MFYVFGAAATQLFEDSIALRFSRRACWTWLSKRTAKKWKETYSPDDFLQWKTSAYTLELLLFLTVLILAVLAGQIFGDFDIYLFENVAMNLILTSTIFSEKWAIR